MSEQEYQARCVEEKLRESLKDHSKEGYTECLVILHNQKYVVTSGFELQVWQQSAILSRPEFKSMQDLLLYARVHHPEAYWYIIREEGQALDITEQTN